MKKNKAVNATEQTFKRLSRLSDISMALSSGTELNELLKSMARTAREALNADEVYFELLDRASFELILSAASGSRRKRPESIRCLDRRTIMNSEEEFGFAPCFTDKLETEDEVTGEALMLRNAFSSGERL